MDTRREAAQQSLVNAAIVEGVHALYAATVAAHKSVDTRTVVTKPLKRTLLAAAIGDAYKIPDATRDAGKEKPAGKSKAEVIAQLLDIENEFIRVRSFNQLAKNNHFDLSIKTAGAKAPESAKRKKSIPGLESKPLKDEVRVSLVSSDKDVLDTLSTRLLQKLTPKTKVEGLPSNIQPWFMRNNGLIQQVLQTSVDGFGAEIQFLPREQARMATRITHHFFKVIRTHDEMIKSFEALPDDIKAHVNGLLHKATHEHDDQAAKQAATIMNKLRRSNQMLSDYNDLAQFLNRLGSAETTDSDRHTFNEMLVSKDKSTQTLDEVSEVGTAKGTARQQPFSDIFKTPHDFESYALFMHDMGKQLDLFPLPLLDTKSSATDVEAAMEKLLTCSQLTHTCYMRDAKFPMKQLWVEKAVANHEKAAAGNTIGMPWVAIEYVDPALARKQFRLNNEVGHGR